MSPPAAKGGNDPDTMNDLLKSILRHVPEHEFTEENLNY